MLCFFFVCFLFVFCFLLLYCFCVCVVVAVVVVFFFKEICNEKSFLCVFGPFFPLKQAKNWTKCVGLCGKSESTNLCMQVRGTNLLKPLGLNNVTLLSKQIMVRVQGLNSFTILFLLMGTAPQNKIEYGIGLLI